MLFALLAFALGLPQAAEPPRLQAVLALSIDPGFEDEWFHTASEHGLRVRSASTVVCGQTFQLYAFAVGYATGPKGQVDLHYDVRIARPDGTNYFEKKGLVLCAAEGIEPGRVQLARDGLGVVFDPPDPRGAYSVEVELFDQLARTRASARAKIELIEVREPVAFADSEALGDWMTDYYQSPDPLRLLEAFRVASAAGVLGAAQPNLAGRAFFRRVCSDNPFLATHLLRHLASYEPAARQALFEVLAGTPYEPAPFLALAAPEEQQAFEKLRASGRGDPFAGPIRDPEQLDELWGTFFATGRFLPIERIARALSLDEQEADAAGGKARTSVLEQAAAWSLGSNLEQHERVREYCRWMLARDKLDRPDADVLRKLLEG